MAAPTDNVIVSDNENIELCEIEATVATGFEQIAKEEVEEKFGVTAKAARGRVIAKIPVSDVKKVMDLGCVDNIRVVMTSWKGVQFPQEELECMGKLRQLVGDVDWKAGLRVWKQLYTFSHPISSSPVREDYDLGEPFLFYKDNLPKKQHKEKKGKFGKKDKFGNKGKDRKKDKMREEAKQFVSDGGRYVQGDQPYLGQGREKFEEGQFDDAESDTDWKSRSTKTPRDVISGSELITATEGLSVKDNELQTQNATDAEKLESKDKQTSAGDGEEVGQAGEHSSSVDPQASLSSPQKLSSETADLQEQDPDSVSPQKPKEKLVPHNPLMPAFRVTCNRAGEGHHFDSQGAAANFGGAVQQYFGWNVDMKKFDIEVILNIEWNDVAVCIGLTRESLHHRNISVFGATTLRPTIAHNMLRLCKIQPGDIVCDPMCGSGSIPIQGARCWPEAFHLSGEKFTKAVDRTVENVQALNKELASENKPSIVVDAAYWDVNYLPFRENSVDVFITDLPFGKRMGSRFSNQRLYPDALLEMARVCRPGTGRVCLLTQDKKCIIKAIQSLSRFWQRRLCLSINLGGLAAGVYLLNRTSVMLNRGPQDQSDHQRDSACTDIRASMPADPQSGPGFTVVKHTFNPSDKSDSSPGPSEETDSVVTGPGVAISSSREAAESEDVSKEDS